MNKDNYEEETPKKLSQMSSIKCHVEKKFIRGNPVNIREKNFVMFISIIKFVSRSCEGAQNLNKKVFYSISSNGRNRQCQSKEDF